MNPLYQWIICAKCWKWPSGSWEEGFQMLSMYLCYAFEKGRDRLKKVEFPSLYCQYILRWREFKFLSGFGEKVNAVVNAFSFFFDIYLHSKQMWPFILTNLKSIQPQMLCAKSGWNRPSGSVEEDFKMSSMFFLLFRYYLPLESGTALYLK